MNRLLSSLNRITSVLFSAIIALLGFSSCEDDGGMNVVMYGAPYGEFEVKGTVTDVDGNPLENTQIIIRPVNIDYEAKEHVDYYYNCDTTYTDVSGQFKVNNEHGFSEYLRIVAHPANKTLESDSIRQKLHYSGGDNSWYMGKAKITQDFILKPSENKEEE